MRLLLKWFFAAVWPKIPRHTRIISLLSRRFIAGSEPEDALALAKKLNVEGFHCMINYIRENAETYDAVLDAAATYAYLFEALRLRGIKADISLKMSQFGVFHNAPMRECTDIPSRFLELVNIWREAYPDTNIWFDGEELRRQKAMQKLLGDGLFGGSVGLVLQAYNKRVGTFYRGLKDSGKNFFWRICKGAYAEPDDYAYSNKHIIRARFISLVTELIREDQYVQVATHDPAIINAIKTYIGVMNLPKYCVEFAMLYDVSPKLAKNLRREGFRVSIYITFGKPEQCEGYVARRIIERPQYLLLPFRSLF